MSVISSVVSSSVKVSSPRVFNVEGFTVVNPRCEVCDDFLLNNTQVLQGLCDDCYCDAMESNVYHSAPMLVEDGMAYRGFNGTYVTGQAFFVINDVCAKVAKRSHLLARASDELALMGHDDWAVEVARKAEAQERVYEFLRTVYENVAGF